MESTGLMAGSDPYRPPMFILFTGPLGSGKTTLIEGWVKGERGAETALIVNDAGPINIDGTIVAQAADALDITELSNGCICCSLKSDLVHTVEALLEHRAAQDRAPFRQIILECSGLAQPGPLFRALAELSHLRMNTVWVSTFDCTSPVSAQKQTLVLEQLAAAQFIIPTKGDLVPSEVEVSLEQDIRTINPLATITHYLDDILQHKTASTLPTLFDKQTTFYSLAEHDSPHDRVSVFCGRYDAADWLDIQEWLANLTAALGERVLRIKALAAHPRTDSRILLQSVGTTFSAPRRINADPSVENGVVLILRDTDISEVTECPSAFPVTWYENHGRST